MKNISAQPDQPNSFANNEEMVEVFRTNVDEVHQSNKLIEKLHQHFPECRINFDLEDCDKVLRIKGRNISNRTVIEILNTNGYQCHIMK